MDESTSALARTLRERMDRETECFAGLGAEVGRLRETFRQKSWGASLVIIDSIERVAKGIEGSDAERDEAFAALRDALGAPREATFSALLARLPDDMRPDLEESWRKLRMEVVRLKTATGRMRYSADALAGALTRILEEAFPSRKGTIYSRRGRATAAAGALLVDRKL